MGKDLGKEKGSKEKETKRAYAIGMMLMSMMGKEDSAERLPVVGHDFLQMF